MITVAIMPAPLRALVLELADQNTILTDRALAALTQAAGNYRASLTLVDTEGRRSRPASKASRRAVRRVRDKLGALQHAIATLPVVALASLSTALNNPLGAVTVPMQTLADAIEPALAALSDQPNKPNDHHLTVWAYEVALVLRDVLEVRPASTRVSNPLVTGTRGGAAYGRLLAASLPLVVVQHVDVDRLIAAGLKLLKDPAGDVYPPHVLVLGPTPKSDG